MAERKSVNKYYPPDWDPSKGSVNKYVGQHPLRDRAKKLGQGILVIRFELPYNIWCGGCNSHVGMGVRYNAEKSKTGNYYSTPIYKFRMKCHLCDNYFEIQTDPKNHDYVILEGARRKEQRWDPKENEQIVPEDKATQKKMATDPMFKLEHGSDDVERGKKVKSNLSSLEVRRDEWKDDYMLNKMARNKFREEKKTIKAVEASDTALLTKSSLGIPLVKEREEDVKLASLMKYRTVESYEEKQTQKRKEIESRPLFQSGAIKPDEDQHESKKLDILKKNLKTAKTISHTSTFDRTKMNTSVTNSPLNKISLGIRKKPMPSITGIIKQRKCVDESDVKSSQNTEREQQSIETCRQYHTGDLKNVSTMDNFQNPIFETNVRNGSNNEDTTNNTSADVNKIVTIIESDSTDRLEEGVTVLNDEGKCPDNDMHGVGKLDNGQILSGYNDALSKTGLSLVLSYSDSDTDS